MIFTQDAEAMATFHSHRQRRHGVYRDPAQPSEF
jgi:hypothetical protein